MFRLMRLQPPYGWSAVWWELAIVTLGVLIALGAQQAADDWQWRGKKKLALEGLRDDALSNDGYNVEAIAVTPCVAAQIDQVIAQIRAGQSTPLPNYTENGSFSYIVRLPDRTWLNTTWGSINTDTTVRHFDAKTTAVLTSAFMQVDKLNDEGRQMQIALSQLNALGQMMAPTPSDRFAALQSATMLRRSIHLYGLVAAQQRKALLKAGLLAPVAYGREALQSSGTVRFCRRHGYPLAVVTPPEPDSP